MITFLVCRRKQIKHLDRMKMVYITHFAENEDCGPTEDDGKKKNDKNTP